MRILYYCPVKKLQATRLFIKGSVFQRDTFAGLVFHVVTLIAPQLPTVLIIVSTQKINPFMCCFYPCSNPQRQEGHMQRFIREVNTTSRSCVLWDLEEETDYIIQVQSIGLYGESQASKKVHFRTLKKTDRFPSNSSNQGKLLWVLIIFMSLSVFRDYKRVWFKE